MLAAELLDVLRRVIGADDPRYAEPPVKLSGGFFTENHAFRLADAPARWDGPLVVRLFPSMLRRESVCCEVEVQRAVAAWGYPAPHVLLFDEGLHLLGRQFVVMERLPGRPIMSGISMGAVLRHGPRLLFDLAHTTAQMQATLHALDPGPLISAVGSTSITIDRWYDFLRQQIDSGAQGFVDGLRWLVDNRPGEGGGRVICHGDWHPGNVLVADGQVSGVLDWTVATVAEPAFDVGFTVMSMSLVPVDAPRPIQRVAARLGRSIARRYVGAYQRLSRVDLSAQSYYEALRCAVELSSVATYRLAKAGESTPDRPAPPWNSIADTMVEYFRVRTGVELRLPPNVD